MFAKNNFLHQNFSSTPSLKARIALSIIFLYLLCSPFYIFESGFPQPADFLLFLGVAGSFLFALTKTDSTINRTYLLGFSFAAYAFFVNVIHYVHYADIRLLLTSLIYVYNVSAFILISYLLTKYPKASHKILFWGIALALLGQFLHVEFIMSEHPFRATGAFNNPNQLAYWALLSAAILLVVKYHNKLNLFDYSLIGIAFYIQLVSLSKAGIITFCLLIFITLFSKAIQNKHRILVFILLIISAATLLTQASTLLPKIAESETVRTGVMRILSIGTEADDSLEGRGYMRLVENPAFLFLGAGEGAFWRYDQEGYDQELHSGIATLVFAYGPLGTFLFVAFIISVLRHKPLFFTALFLVIMLFGATHQNLRFSLFWVFLAGVNSLPRVTQKAPIQPEMNDSPSKA